MSAKLSALLFIFGLIAVAHGSTNERTEVDEEISNDVGISVDERISIDKILTDAQDDVTKLKNFIASVSDKIESGAAGVIRNAYGAFDKAAAQRLQHTNDVLIHVVMSAGQRCGYHVSECIDSLKGNVNNDSLVRSRGVGTCITSEVDSALNDVETLLSAAQSAERDIGAARAALSACDKIKNVFKKVECVAKETANVTGQTISLAAKVAGAVANAYKLYKSFPSDVSSCEAYQLVLAGQDALSLIAQLTKC